MNPFARAVTPLMVVLIMSAVNSYAAPKFVGVDGCRCHQSEISDWGRSKHAKAFELLEPGKRITAKKKAGLDPDQDYTKDTKCQKCHTTGYKEEGGFQDLASTPNMTGIQCEMCHGAGSEFRNLHKEKTTKFTVEEAKALGQTFGSMDVSVCKKCHEHKDTPFRPEVDDKYKFNHQEALKNDRAFHKMYPLEGKH